jgi:hypothetical protein
MKTTILPTLFPTQGAITAQPLARLSFDTTLPPGGSPAEAA